MQTIRTFIAVPLPPSVRSAVVRLVRRLSGSGDGIKWVPTDHLHLTLKFLGDVDNVDIPHLCSTLRGICANVDPFDLRFEGTGVFPHADRPRVLWVGIRDDSDRLKALVAEIETEFAELGFKPEPRDYRPHLTLGRVRAGQHRAAAEVVTQLLESRNVAFGEMQVDTVQVMASFLDKKGPSYEVMDTIELAP